MKFAIINDTHFGPVNGGFIRGVQRKLIGESERLMRDFVHRMNTYERPEFVMHLGDLIEDVNDRETDVLNFQKALHIISGLEMPIYFLIGNHDVRTLDEIEIAQLLGYEKMYYSFDHSGFHIVVLSFEMTENHTQALSEIGAKVPDIQIEWLVNDLKNTTKPTLVFIHYGLADDDMVGNFWFESNPHHAVLQNRKDLRRIFEQSGKVKAVISAHQHWNRMFVHNNIPYFTVTSLIENFNNDGIPAAAYTVVDIDSGRILVDVKGNDAASYEFVFA